MNELRIGSLFSGIGGIELGFEKAGGFKTLWFVENEPYAQAILRKHWPRCPIYGDIRKIDFKKLEKVDILTGGFPCQDISNAGKRRGIEGKRSGLWKEYLRAISEIRPRYALVENVSALTFRGLLIVLGDLAEIGYDAEWHCVPASAVGAPHRRDRVFILAYSSDIRRVDRQDPKHPTEARKPSLGDACPKSLMADSDNRRGKEQEIFSRWDASDFSCQNVADASSDGRANASSNASGTDTRSKGGGLLEFTRESHRNRRSLIERLRERNKQKDWFSDAGILRVAYGVPNRVDRIRCLGNGVVPQVVEIFAEIIKEREKCFD